jgi:hypothetical protein
MSEEIKDLLPSGRIYAWPDDWIGNIYDADNDHEDWIVGIPINHLTDKPCALNKKHRPIVWNAIAIVYGRARAEALARHLNEIRGLKP